MQEILTKTIKEISQLLDAKKISSVELTKMVFERVKEVEPKVRAFITLCEKEALEQAQESDKRRVRGLSKSKIDGVPISIKDILCTKDVRTTAGSKMLGDFVPPYDATVVKRLKDAGAVIIGKTNLDAWGHGSSTENSDFGPSKNPWDLDRVPGGSSGGSAVAVASGMGFASIGTDTGGSIRQPATYCGITGLKPTYGRNSRYGYIAMASSTDTIGPMTRSVEDTAILLEIIAGHDPLDSTTVPGKKFEALNTKSETNSKFKIQNLKIGLPREYFKSGLDYRITQKIEEAKKVLEKLGVKFVEISLPMTDYGLACYYILQPAELSSNLARYDGIKYGFSVEKVNDSYRKLRYVKDSSKQPSLTSKATLTSINQQSDINLSDVYNMSRAVGFGAEAKRRIMMGTYVLSAGYYDAYYKKAMKVRTLVINDFKKAYEKVDVILTPTTPTLPFKFGQKSNDPVQMYLEDIYTVTANIAGIPGVSVPCGFVKNPRFEVRNPKQIKNLKSQISNLPVGMQILGPQFEEETILRIADSYQKETDWHMQVSDIESSI